jgi:acetyl esterase/lipase
MNRIARSVLLFIVVCSATMLPAAEPDEIVDVWPGKPPGEPRDVGPEKDLTKPEDNLIAGARIIKLGNVTRPQLHVFLPPKEKRNGTAVVICPGGGFHILAWDLEGTEVAEWLNSIGVTALVLKYRVPSRPPNTALMAVQDTERAMSLARSKAGSWKVSGKRIGVLGFSAGGHAAAHVATQFSERSYDMTDDVDKVSCRPDFTILIYPGGIIDDKTDQLKPGFEATKETPPTFFAHAEDDGSSCKNSLQLFASLKKAGVKSELHIYDAGGHGYGLRRQKQFPVTSWPDRCSEWLERGGWLAAQ